MSIYNESTTEEVNNSMADQQQLDLLRQGVKDWNAWRKQHPGIRPDLRGADLREANLREANLREANLSGASLKEADLSLANLSLADLSRADLSDAKLHSAILDATNLSDANLSGADLYGAVLYAANLSRANLSRANLSGAVVGQTIFGSVDLRTVKGLVTVRHLSPSTIGTDTLLRSEGDIPETFLRDAGLTDTFITSTHSLTQNPIEYYTCFISYSTKDRGFVERLYADLRAKGVRCWYAPVDLKTGEEFQRRIEEAIRSHDKLLVVLSEHSLNSIWVENEVMAALEREQQQHKWVLFPITLDERVMQTSLPWAATIRRTRHIGDFTCWKDHDAYQKGLERLMRDLQPDHPPTSKF